MKINNYLKTNTNFVFANNLNINDSDYVSIQPINQECMDIMLDYLTTHDGYKTYISTNHGDFLLLPITQNFTDKYINSIINNTTKDAYYFRCTDYYEYGHIKIASDGKIIREISYDSHKSKDNQCICVGTPHKWETKHKHTYTLDNMMVGNIINSDIVDKMISYYLPFTLKDMKINKMYVYTKDKNINETLNALTYDVTRDYTFKQEDYNNTFLMALKKSVRTTATAIVIMRNKLCIHNLILDLITDDRIIDDNSLILNSKVCKYINYHNFNYTTFYRAIMSCILDYQNAEIIKLNEVMGTIKDIENTDHIQATLITQYDYKTMQTSIYFDYGVLYDQFTGTLIRTTKRYQLIGKCFDEKLVKKLYKIITRLIRIERNPNA